MRSEMFCICRRLERSSGLSRRGTTSKLKCALRSSLVVVFVMADPPYYSVYTLCPRRNGKIEKSIGCTSCRLDRPHPRPSVAYPGRIPREACLCLPCRVAAELDPGLRDRRRFDVRGP